MKRGRHVCWGRQRRMGVSEGYLLASLDQNVMYIIIFAVKECCVGCAKYLRRCLREVLLSPHF